MFCFFVGGIIQPITIVAALVAGTAVAVYLLFSHQPHEKIIFQIYGLTALLVWIFLQTP